MAGDKRIDAYLRETLELLEDDRFEVFEDERYQDQRFRAVAVKVQGLGIGSQELVFVFARFARLTSNQLEDFSDDAYAYAKEARKSSWPINLFWVYPVALAEEATDTVISRLREEDPRIQGFGYVAFPVVYDAADDEVYFYEGSARAMHKVAQFVEKYLLLD